METFALVVVAVVAGYLGFSFYQKRRSSEIHPLDASVNKTETPVETKLPETNPHIEFPSAVTPDRKVEEKAPEWNGFPKNESDAKAEQSAPKPKRGGRQKKAETVQQPKASPATRKKKTKAA